MGFIEGVIKFFTRKHPRSGKDEKVYYVEGPNGEKKILLNPDQRGRKFAQDLHNKKDGFTKQPLSNTQLAYRSGYLRSRSDNAKAYKKNKAKKAEARKAKKGGN